MVREKCKIKNHTFSFPPTKNTFCKSNTKILFPGDIKKNKFSSNARHEFKSNISLVQ